MTSLALGRKMIVFTNVAAGASRAGGHGAQGVAESINFQDAGRGNVATTGDFVLTAQEVNLVISALEEHQIQVTALHNHMLSEQPRLFFMHFWGVGTPEALSAGPIKSSRLAWL